MGVIKQLSGQDATFLYMDTDCASTGGTMIYIYDQSTIPGGGHLRFKQILQHIDSRLATAPIFRQKLQQVALSLDYPYWVDDEQFRIENHVFHVALPKPGDWRQFCILASRLTKPHFDLNRPLWEMYVVEGLDNIDWLPKGSFAILTRMHHAAVDGTAAAQLTWALHDLDAKGKKPGVDSPQRTKRARAPGMMEIAARAWWNNTTSPMRLARPLTSVLPNIGKTLINRGQPDIERTADTDVPSTRFNNRVSPFRVYTTARFELDKFKAVRQSVAGSTINDVVVTIVAGAVRRYLKHHRELPATTLSALMPVNTRPSPDAEPGANSITFMTAAIGTDIKDPKQRLAYVQEHTSRSKTMMQAIGANELTDINKHIPASLLTAAGKLISLIGMDAGATGKRLFNVGISNVPGPNVPLYLLGARMKFWSIVGPCYDGMGTVFAVTSYDNMIYVAPTACRDIVPDPEFLAECLEHSFDELFSATCAPAKRPAKKRTTAKRGAKAKRRPAKATS